MRRHRGLHAVWLTRMGTGCTATHLSLWFQARLSMTLERVVNPAGSVEMRCPRLIGLCLRNYDVKH